MIPVSRYVQSGIAVPLIRSCSTFLSWNASRIAFDSLNYDTESRGTCSVGKSPVTPMQEETVASNGKSVFIKSFGCSHNMSDGEYMGGILRDGGYSIVQDRDKADVW